MSRSYSPVLLLIVLSLVGMTGTHAQNAYLANVSLPRYIKAGVNYPIAVRARNASTTPYTSFSISWRLDGGATNTGPSQGVGGGGITQNNFLPYTHPVQLNTTQGPHTLEVWITTAVDTDPANNKVTIQFTALNNWAEKVVLLESRTETWCPNCPDANDVTNGLMANPDLAVTKFHLSDALNACAECITYYNQHNINYTPAGIVEMGEYGDYAITSNYSIWEADMAARAQGVSPVELTMTSSVNNATRQLTVTLNAEFTYLVQGGMSLNVYVLEDDVPGPQTSAPSGYVHQRVMRAMLGGSNGSTDVIPNTPVVGNAYSRTYTYTVPATYNMSKLHLIGVLEHRLTGFNDRYALNSVNRSVAGVGIDELALGDERLEAYPNPFSERLNVGVDGITGNAMVELIGMDGRVAHRSNVVLTSMASSPVELGGANLPNGAYVLRVITSEGVAEQRVIRMDQALDTGR